MVAGNHDTPRAAETGCILRLFAPLGMHVVDAEPQRARVSRARPVGARGARRTRRPRPMLDPDPARAVQRAAACTARSTGMLAAVRARRTSARPSGDPAGRAARARAGATSRSGTTTSTGSSRRTRTTRGSIEYTSANTWGELHEERDGRLPGKGIIEHDLATGAHTFHPLAPSRAARRPADAHRRAGMTAAELDARDRRRASSVRRAASTTRSCGWSCATCRDTSRASSITRRCASSSAARCTSTSTRGARRSSARCGQRRAGPPAVARRHRARQAARARDARATSIATRSSTLGPALPEARPRSATARRAALAAGAIGGVDAAQQRSASRTSGSTPTPSSRSTPGSRASSAPNGSGKTTMLEAIAWALYGKSAARGTRDSHSLSARAARARRVKRGARLRARRAIAIASCAG